jgi:plastocyanin domain-containing protein
MTTRIRAIVASAILVVVTTFFICTTPLYGALASLPSAGAGLEVKISVTEEGFNPTNVVLRRGVQSRITFVRQVANTCATEIVVQELAIRVALPLNEPVSVDVTPRSAGQYDYGCGTGAFHGTIMVR